MYRRNEMLSARVEIKFKERNSNFDLRVIYAAIFRDCNQIHIGLYHWNSPNALRSNCWIFTR